MHLRKSILILIIWDRSVMTWQKLQQPRIEHVGRPIGAVAACTGTPVDVEAAPAHHCFVPSPHAREQVSRSISAYAHRRPDSYVDMDAGGFTGRQTLTQRDLDMHRSEEVRTLRYCVAYVSTSSWRVARRRPGSAGAASPLTSRVTRGSLYY